MDLLDLWFAVWEYLYRHPVNFFALFIGAVLAACLLACGIKWLAARIRFARWARRQVWYIDGGGHFYRKDRS